MPINSLLLNMILIYNPLAHVIYVLVSQINVN
jgi:hypothetical protein